MKDKISIIVPVYNVEHYIHKCIDSILSQTYVNLEIILVDDGSTDASGEICEHYSLKDKRIKVLHKINGGLSDARNAGIEMSTGKYLSFIDSDDFIDSNMIETLHTLITENNAEISICTFYEFKNDKSHSKSDTGKIFVYKRQDAMNQLIVSDKIGNYAWNKLYDASLFSTGVRYPKGMVYEDVATTPQLFHLANKVVYMDKPKYHYRIRPDSISREVKFKPNGDRIQVNAERFDFILKNYPDLAKDEAVFQLDSIMYCYSLLTANGLYKTNKDLLKNSRQVFMNQMKDINKLRILKDLSLKNKIKAIVFFTSISSFNLFINLLYKYFGKY